MELRNRFLGIELTKLWPTGKYSFESYYGSLGDRIHSIGGTIFNNFFVFGEITPYILKKLVNVFNEKSNLLFCYTYSDMNVLTKKINIVDCIYTKKFDSNGIAHILEFVGFINMQLGGAELPQGGKIVVKYQITEIGNETLINSVKVNTYDVYTNEKISVTTNENSEIQSVNFQPINGGFFFGQSSVFSSYNVAKNTGYIAEQSIGNVFKDYSAIDCYEDYFSLFVQGTTIQNNVTSENDVKATQKQFEPHFWSRELEMQYPDKFKKR